MQVTETSAEGLKREFTVVVPANDIEQKLSSRLSEIGHSVKVPGFRPGKVPMGLLKKRYGDAVRGEVLEQAVQDSLREAMTERELRPVGEPKIEIVTFEDGADLEYKLALELMPEIPPVDYSAITLERVVAKVGEAEIEDALKRIGEGQRSFAPVTDGRASREGDTVVIDFVGKIDGEEFPGGTLNDFEMELTGSGFLPGFTEQVVGVKAGESKSFTVSVPEDHGNEQLRGKEIAFDVTVKEVKEPAPVTVDDEFAKANGLDDLAALKAMVREQLERDYGQISRARLKRELLDQLTEQSDFELPQGIVDGEFEQIWKEVEAARERGTLEEDDKDKSEEELKASYREIAERRVRLGLLLTEVGRVNNISVSQEELNRAMHAQASRFPGQEAQFLEYYQKNPEALQELQAPIFEDKVIDFVIEMATVTDREVTPEELMRDPDTEAQESAAAEEKGKAKKSSKKAKGRTRSRAKASDSEK